MFIKISTFNAINFNDIPNNYKPFWDCGKNQVFVPENKKYGIWTILNAAQTLRINRYSDICGSFTYIKWSN